MKQKRINGTKLLYPQLAVGDQKFWFPDNTEGAP